MAESRLGLGPLGRRLLLAFVLVAMSSVVVLTIAALIGTSRGISASEDSQRQAAATATAAAVSESYLAASGWVGADLGRAEAIANAAGARLVVLDALGIAGTGLAGFSGNQLGVVWMGRDDNSPTRLYGSTGALRAWIDLFKRLPAQALASSRQGLEFVWIDPQSTQRSDPVCTGARELPFIEGYAPQERHGCALDKLRDWFGGNDE